MFFEEILVAHRNVQFGRSSEELLLEEIRQDYLSKMMSGEPQMKIAVGIVPCSYAYLWALIIDGIKIFRVDVVFYFLERLSSTKFARTELTCTIAQSLLSRNIAVGTLMYLLLDPFGRIDTVTLWSDVRLSSCYSIILLNLIVTQPFLHRSPWNPHLLRRRNALTSPCGLACDDRFRGWD